MTLVFWIMKILATILGGTGGAMIFSGLLLTKAALYYLARISRTGLFWAAFILTRPLGAVAGDFLDKPLSKGGMEISRYTASEALFVLIFLCIFIFSHRAAKKSR